MTVQWVGLRAFSRRARVQSLFREPWFHNLHSAPWGGKENSLWVVILFVTCTGIGPPPLLFLWEYIALKIFLAKRCLNHYLVCSLQTLLYSPGVLFVGFRCISTSCLLSILADSIGEWCNNPFCEVGGQEVISAYLSRGTFPFTTAMWQPLPFWVWQSRH